MPEFFPTLIRRARLERGIPQWAVALWVGVSSGTYQRWETAREIPVRRRDAIPKLAIVLGIPLEELEASVYEATKDRVRYNYRWTTWRSSSPAEREEWAEDYRHLNGDGKPFITRRLAQQWGIDEQAAAWRTSRLFHQGYLTNGKPGQRKRQYCEFGHERKEYPSGYSACPECRLARSREQYATRKVDPSAPLCSIPGCPLPSDARGWCSRHYQRWRATGNPTGSKPRAKRPHRTHCPQGHPYEGENLYITTKGHYACRACKRATEAKRRAKHKSAHTVINE